MRLYEHDGRSLFRKYGIAVPDFETASDVDGALRAAERVGFPALIKAQVLVGSRGKAGGVILVKRKEEARKAASKMLSSEVRGETVSKVMVSRYVEVEQELYLSLALDRSTASPIFLASSHGGVDIEEIAKTNRDKIAKERVDLIAGFTKSEGEGIAQRLSLPKELHSTFASVCSALYSLMMDLDADLVEINPLALTTDHHLVALDAKVILNDEALYRHPEFKDRESTLNSGSEFERFAQSKGVKMVDLGGNIGIIGNGAGLTMATIDLVKTSGGDPADFLDIGGGASAEQFERCLSVLLDYPRVKLILINIFGGITRCDDIATGVKEALSKHTTRKRMLVRLVGTNEAKGKEVIDSIPDAEIESFVSADEAACRAANLTREEP
jgi:succinyl-CoA synthetase beta subunit